MKDQIRKKILVLFIIRIFLWITALIPTVYWVWYSFKLTADGIYDHHEYATLLRPVLYTCVVIAFIAICISFILHAISSKLKKQLLD